MAVIYYMRKLECKAPPQPLLGRARGAGSLGERTSCALHQSLSQASAPRACPSLLADRRNALIMWALREVGFWWETQNCCCLSQINFQLLRARLHMRFFMRFRCDFGAILRTKLAPAYPARGFSSVTLRRNTVKLAGIKKKGVFK